MAPVNNKRKNNRGGRKNATKLLMPISEYPNLRRIVMTYPARISVVESGASLGATYFFRLNSVFDPDATGVGGFALGYTKWSELYSNYKVRRATARADLTVTGISVGALAQVSLFPVALQPVLPSNPTVWALRPGCKKTHLSLASNGGHNVASLTGSWDLHTVLSVTKDQYTDDMDFSGAVGSNPARQAYCAVSLVVSGSSSVGTLNGFVYMTYEVEWFNPIPLQ